MIFPLVILAIGAVLAGYLNWPKANLSEFLGKSPSVHAAYLVASERYQNAPPGVVNPELFGVIDKAPNAEQSSPWTWAMLIGGGVSIAGIVLAGILHLADRAAAERIAADIQPVTTLLEGKYFIDEIYQSVIVEPLRDFGRAFFWIDRIIVDGLVWGAGFVPQLGGFALKLTVQRGHLQGYAAAMLFGILAILLIVFL